ncbi:MULTISPECIES: MFS transporter [unclassified Nocardiopsis]|uniref:MFS transporter n=1 Tax=Nocardiopsis TaxID=2013 RepID=UPI00387AB57F
MTGLDTATERSAGRRITFFVALAVFAQESTWSFYDAQVPPLLREYLASTALVGLIMGMDNLLGIFVQPWMGNRSDNTRTRWGRRIPYLVVGMPIAALLFATLPLASSLPVLIAVIFAYALVANSFKPVTESLLPDFIRPERRSRAAAAVKIATSLTIIVSALISAFMIDSHPVLAFWVPSALMLVAVTVLVTNIRDSTSPAYRSVEAEDARAAEDALAAENTPATENTPAAENAAQGGAPRATTSVWSVVADIARDRNRDRLLVLVAILFFGGAWASVRALITPYGMEVLGLSRGDAGGLTLSSGVVFILVALPVALLSERIGRLRVMGLGMALFAVAMVVGTVFATPAGTLVMLGLTAVAAAGFMVNAAVILWNLAPSARVLGTYTGLYTVGYASGSFLGPALVGAMVDLTGWRFLLVDAALLAALAVVAVVPVELHRRRDPEAAAL